MKMLCCFATDKLDNAYHDHMIIMNSLSNVSKDKARKSTVSLILQCLFQYREKAVMCLKQLSLAC